jgi:mRNA interferase RelE/StbE
VAHSIEYASAAARELAKLPRAVQLRVRDRIDGLAKDPRPPGAEALRGDMKGLLRVRTGDYRVVYSVEDRVLVVLVVRIAHRREVYRR